MLTGLAGIYCSPVNNGLNGLDLAEQATLGFDADR
jgi:hypothetical protein